MQDGRASVFAARLRPLLGGLGALGMAGFVAIHVALGTGAIGFFAYGCGVAVALGAYALAIAGGHWASARRMAS
jgi:hypothetical protein